RNEDLVVATQNQDSLLVFGKTLKQANAPKWISLKSDDFSAEITYKDGRKRREEFHYGSTYLSQSSRTVSLDKDVIKCTITSFKGTKREVL
ncbi:MAG TPA: hypothetical protein VEZ17_11905, partial [Chitinophagaceae bacterium]|nr:hypothetical protein [Chitinophagaceae bacterium]